MASLLGRCSLDPRGSMSYRRDCFFYRDVYHGRSIRESTRTRLLLPLLAKQDTAVSLHDGTSNEEDEEESSLLSLEESSSWEYQIQSVVAIVLLGALGLSAANVLLKIGVIAFALVSVAVRYTIIGILLIVLLFWFI